MPPLTELLEKPIRDPNGEAVASLHDLVVRIYPSTELERNDSASPEIYPPVTGVVARLKSPTGARDVYIPWDQVRHMGADGVELAQPVLDLQRFHKRPNEIVLKDGLFDKQVVDVEGRRVVRINDLDLQQRDGTWRLIGVDVSPAAMLRQLPLLSRLSRHVPAGPLIDWKDVVPVGEIGGPEGGAVRLRVPRERLELLSPVELAEVVEQLTPAQGAELLGDLDEARAADTLEELEDEQQGQILRAMEPERAADVLEEMEPDEAADALQSVSEEEAADLLGRMDREDAAEVQELLGYPEDSAGGLMTTDYVSVPDWATIGEVVEALRRHAKLAASGEEDPLPEALADIYVVAPPGEGRPAVPSRPRQQPRGRGPVRPRVPVAQQPRTVSVYTEGKLVGIVTLRDLLLADPQAPIAGITRAPTHVGHPLDNEQDVAHIIADDDLLALPIVDDDNELLGIVTVDDAIDVILPTAWKKRMPRLFH
jgi:CBS domain-containing protein/sporulation protein YlmC with PRC-barrel domain